MYTYNYNGDYSLGPRAFYYWCCCCWWLRRKPWNFFTLGTSRGTCSLSFSLSLAHTHTAQRTNVRLLRKRETWFAFLLHVLHFYWICCIFILLIHTTSFTVLHSGILPAAELICSRVFVRSTTQHFYMYVCMSMRMRIFVCVYICIQFVVAARSAVAIFFIFVKQTTALSETSLTPTAHFERLNWNEWKTHDERAKIKTKQAVLKVTRRKLNTLAHSI